MELSNSKFEEITQAIQNLWIYQNKKMDQARKETFSRYSPGEVAAYRAMEARLSAQDGGRSDQIGTF